MPESVQLRLRPFAMATICIVSFATANLAIAINADAQTSNDSSAVSSNRMTPVVRAIKAANDCVVDIEGKKMVRNDGVDGDPNKAFKQVKGMGTGVIFDPRGYILTNYHVVDGVARIQVRMADQTETIARLIAHDSRTDLAIIKIDLERKLPVIRIGTSGDLMVGETVIAIGNAYGYRHSSTVGIISALHRNVPISESQVYYDLIQIDAAINPGNSGGPLLNIDGELIGINAAVRVGAQCIAFTITINSALEIAADLMSSETREKIALDFQAATVYENHQPVLKVKAVEPGSNSGLKVDDTIVQVNGQPVSRRVGLERALIGMRNGDAAKLEVQRGSKRVACRAKLASNRLASRPAVKKQFGSIAWEMLGMELEQISTSEFSRVSSEHNGGMRVKRVRSGSPAAAQSIQRGDVLIGIHEWETTSQNDVEFILNQKEIRDEEKVKYYIVRGETTLWGLIRVAQPLVSSRQR